MEPVQSMKGEVPATKVMKNNVCSIEVDNILENSMKDPIINESKLLLFLIFLYYKSGININIL